MTRWVLLQQASALLAGTIGTLGVVVKGKKAGESLPDVGRTLSGAGRGISTDREGRLVMQNPRAGEDGFRIFHVGHRTPILRDVVINPDTRTSRGGS